MIFKIEFDHQQFSKDQHKRSNDIYQYLFQSISEYENIILNSILDMYLSSDVHIVYACFRSSIY